MARHLQVSKLVKREQRQTVVLLRSKVFMGHPSLKVDTTKIKDLLDEKYYSIVLNKHIEYTQQRMPIWLQNALDKNTGEWSIVFRFVEDFEGHYESSMPNDINSMLIQQVSGDTKASSTMLLYLPI